MKELGVWVEVTTLVIPGHNDSDKELQEIASFLVSVDRTIPWHVTAFHPMFKMTDRPPTDPATLARARKIGIDAGLCFVYEGNVPGLGGENTFCPGCGNMVIQRHGFSIRENRLVGGKCPDCFTHLPGIWE
jgi:pyruvate formate lyase activating enzyme